MTEPEYTSTVASEPQRDFDLLRGLVSDVERTAILAEIAANRSNLRRTAGAAGFGPRYSVIDGQVIAAGMPLVASIGSRLLPIVGRFAGHEVRPLGDSVRWGRVQCYDDPSEGFRWHFDGHDFAAVVTLVNEAGGGTELVGRGVSRIVRPFFYAFYALHRIFSILPCREVCGAPGDVLLIRGRDLLHRGKQRRPGRRTVLVFAFDTPGREVSRLRAWFARFVNY
jgi:hypothetical protein